MAGAAFDAGSVVGRLVLDLNEWSANIEKAKKDTGTLASEVEKNKAVIQDLGKAFTVAGAAITLALGSALKKAADYGDALAKTSQKTGVAVETLSGLKLAADLSGTSMEGLAAALAKMSRTMDDARSGSVESQETFKRLGVTVTDSAGNLKPMDNMLGEVADKFKAMPDGVEKSALAMDIFGRAGVQMIPLLNQGAAGLKEQRAEAERLGLVMKGDAARASEAFNDNITRLRASFMGIAITISQALMPVVDGIIKLFTSASVALRKVYEFCPPLGSALTVITGAFGSLLAVLGPVLLMLPRLISGWQSVALLIPKVVTAIKAASTAMSLSIPIYAAVAAGIIAINAATNAYIEHCDEMMAKTWDAAETSAKGWKFAQDSMKGLTTVTAAEMKKIIANWRLMGKTSDEIGEQIAAIFEDKISAAAKAAVKDTEDMAKKIGEIQDQLTDKLKSLTLSETQYKIWQAQQYYVKIKEQARGSMHEAQIVADANKAEALEVARIRKEAAEAAAEAEKQSAEKSKKAGEEMWRAWEQGAQDAGPTVGQVFWQAGEKVVAAAKMMLGSFGPFFRDVESKGDDVPKKMESNFSKAMKKIDGYLNVVQQGFGQFFSAIQAKSDNYYKAQFAALDKLYDKQKSALEKEYNAKIAALDAKDAAEALSNQRQQIMLSDMTEEEKAAALAEIEMEQEKISERQKIEAEYAAAKEALELEQTKKRKELEKAQAEANKKSAIVQAYINMATAITASWKLGFPLGAIAAAIAAAMCMIQINTIKSQPIPEMAEGGIVRRPTIAMIGEAGPEAVMPLRELRRMLGVTTKKGGAGSRSINVNIQTVDATGMERLFNSSIIPRLKKALLRETLTVSPNAVR